MKARPRMEKRRKELQRQERKQRKAERREQRKAERTDPSDAAPGEDPDLVGIVAGPQPLPAEFGIIDDDATEEAATDGAEAATEDAAPANAAADKSES